MAFTSSDIGREIVQIKRGFRYQGKFMQSRSEDLRVGLGGLCNVGIDAAPEGLEDGVIAEQARMVEVAGVGEEKERMMFGKSFDQIPHRMVGGKDILVDGDKFVVTAHEADPFDGGLCEFFSGHGAELELMAQIDDRFDRIGRVATEAAQLLRSSVEIKVDDYVSNIEQEGFNHRVSGSENLAVRSERGRPSALPRAGSDGSRIYSGLV